MDNNSEKHRIEYAMNRHHCQALASALNPLTKAVLQISPKPSENCKRAFKNVFLDEMEKQRLCHEKKKEWEANLDGITRDSFKERRILRDSADMNLRKSGGSVHEPTRFKDFNEEKLTKYENHIRRNLEDGVTRFTSQEAYQTHKHNMKNLMKTTLLNQIGQKQHLRIESLAKQQAENDHFREMQLNNYQNLQTSMKKSGMSVYQSSNRQSASSINPFSLHNPITNPIEYHIENPYILKRIQDHYR